MMEIKVRETGMMIATSIGASFKFMDFTAIIRSVEGMKKNPDLVYLGIFDQQDNLTSSFNPRSLKLDLPAMIHDKSLFTLGEICFFSTPINFEQEIYGNLLIGYSLKEMHLQIRSNTINGLLICLVILILGTLLTVSLSQILTKNIVKLKDAAQKFTPGEKHSPILIESNDEVGELCATYNKLIEEIDFIVISLEKNSQKLQKTTRKLEERNQLLGDFIHIASHDFREPLRKIITFGDMLENSLSKSIPKFSYQESADYLKRMQNASRRMNNLISDLLKYSRVIVQADFDFQPVLLQDIVEQVLLDLELQISASDGKVDVNPLPEIEADPFQLQQVFTNLISNSLKFHKTGVSPVIKIKSESSYSHDEGSVCKISIKDNGIGFDQKYAEKAFKPLERLVGRSEYEGTGMGLSICKRIMEHHSGTITVESYPGKGTKIGRAHV